MLDVGTGILAKGIRQSLTDEEKRLVKTLLVALDIMRELRGDMPMQYVMTFRLVAEEEGLGITEYAQKAGVAQSVMTRHVLDIGDRDRYRGEGMGLVYKQVDPMEQRKHRVWLTDKGRVIMRRIIRAIETGRGA